MECPPVWAFHLAIIAVALLRRDRDSAKLGGILLCNWIAGRANYMVTGDQYNPGLNFVIDYVSFLALTACFAVPAMVDFNGLVAAFSRSILRLDPLSLAEVFVGCAYLVTCACHAWLAWGLWHHRPLSDMNYFYWQATHTLTWAQMWFVGFVGIGGGHVVRQYCGVLYHRVRDGGHASPAVAGLQTGGASEGRLDGGHWKTDRRLPIGWALWVASPGVDRASILAAAIDLGLDQADDLYVRGKRYSPRLDSLGINFGRQGSRDIATDSATNRHARGTGGVHGDASASERGEEGMKVRAIGAALLAAFHVPDKATRQKHVDEVIAHADAVREAAEKMTTMCCADCGEDMDEALRKVASRL